MLEAFVLNLFLITIIFLRLPEANMGLTSFSNKSRFLGSPASIQRVLNISIALGIIGYFGLAMKLDFSTQ